MRLCMRGWKSQRCTSVFALRLHLSRRPSSCLTELQDLLPGIINQLGPDNLANLKKLAETYQGGQAPPGANADDDDDEDVPDLVDNFEEAAK